MAGIRRCIEEDFETICSIINEAAIAYKGVIPADRWKEPYMSRSELERETREGVRFWGYEEEGKLVGVMGIQDVKDVSLIRHAYVRNAYQGRGIGGKLLSFLCDQATRPLLVGTWADATWAIRFYEKHGFKRVTKEAKDKLLKTYWMIPARQIETSVVLADKNWISKRLSG